MPNLSDDNAAEKTTPMPYITADAVRYTTMANAVETVLSVYHNSIDPELDKPWPFSSTVDAFVVDPPTSGWKMWMLKFKIRRALEEFMPVKSVEIHEDGIRVEADKTSDRAPACFAIEVRRRG